MLTALSYVILSVERDDDDDDVMMMMMSRLV